MDIQAGYVKIPEQYSIIESKDTKLLLLDAINRFEIIDIDLRAMKAIDVSILQLLVAARASALMRGRKITLLTEHGSPFEAAAKAAGFLGKDGDGRSAEERFWTGEAIAQGELI